MPADSLILLHNIALTLHTTLSIKTNAYTLSFIKSDSASSLDTADKLYYSKYSVQLTQHLINHLGDIEYFELIDSTSDANKLDKTIDYDIILKSADKRQFYISLSYKSIKVKNLMPDKIMKVCKYKRNSKIYKAYTGALTKINNSAYHKIKNSEKYSDISEATKTSIIYSPVCELVMQTLGKKRNVQPTCSIICSMNRIESLSRFIRTDSKCMILVPN